MRIGAIDVAQIAVDPLRSLAHCSKRA